MPLKYLQLFCFIFLGLSTSIALPAQQNTLHEISKAEISQPIENFAIANRINNPNPSTPSTSEQKQLYYKEFDPHIDVTPTARGCPEASGPYFSGSFIYWKSQLEKEDIVEKNTGSLQDTTVFKIKQKEINFKYTPGFKLGAGYNFKRDFWDVFLNWTLLNSKKSHFSLNSKLQPVDFVFLYIPVTVGPGEAYSGGSINARWDLHFTTLDFEIGRNCFIGRNLNIRPFVGVKADWIKWKFKNKYRDFFNTDFSMPLGPINALLKENNRGIGPRMGFNSRWILSSYNFSLFANAAAALLWTNMRGNKTFQITPPESVTFATLTKAHRHELKPVIEYLMGFDWSRCIKKRFNLYLSAGYEMQFWWDQTATEINLTPLFFNGEIHASQALMLHGLTASARLDF